MSDTVAMQAVPVRRSGQCALPFESGPPVVPAAAALVSQARRGIAAARAESDVVERFTGAYLSALRAAAAVLTAQGRPHRGRAKPESVWSLLDAAAPELAGWSAYFGAHSARHAAAQAGATRGVDDVAAGELLERAGQFVAVVDVFVGEAVGVQGSTPGAAGSGGAPAVPARCAAGSRAARVRRR